MHLICDFNEKNLGCQCQLDLLRHTFHVASQFFFTPKLPTPLIEKHSSPKMSQLMPNITSAVIKFSKVKFNRMLFLFDQSDGI